MGLRLKGSSLMQIESNAEKLMQVFYALVLPCIKQPPVWNATICWIHLVDLIELTISLLGEPTVIHFPVSDMEYNFCV